MILAATSSAWIPVLTVLCSGSLITAIATAWRSRRERSEEAVVEAAQAWGELVKAQGEQIAHLKNEVDECRQRDREKDAKLAELNTKVAHWEWENARRDWMDKEEKRRGRRHKEDS